MIKQNVKKILNLDRVYVCSVGFRVALVVKNPIPGWGRSPGGEHDSPLQYSCLENPMDRGAWSLQQTVRHN